MNTVNLSKDDVRYLNAAASGFDTAARRYRERKKRTLGKKASKRRLEKVVLWATKLQLEEKGSYHRWNIDDVRAEIRSRVAKQVDAWSHEADVIVIVCRGKLPRRKSDFRKLVQRQLPTFLPSFSSALQQDMAIDAFRILCRETAENLSEIIAERYPTPLERCLQEEARGELPHAAQTHPDD